MNSFSSIANMQQKYLGITGGAPRSPQIVPIIIGGHLVIWLLILTLGYEHFLLHYLKFLLHPSDSPVSN